MSDTTFLNAQIGEMKRMPARSANNPILAPQRERRIAEAESRLAEAVGTELPASPRTAVFFVRAGEREIRIPARTVTTLLAGYEAMFVTHFLQRETIAGRRGDVAGRPTLYLDGVLREPYGFTWSCPRTRDDALRDGQAWALGKIDEAIETTVEPDARFEMLPTGVLRPLGQFLRTSADLHCGLELVSPRDTVRRLPAEQVRAAAERLAQEVVAAATIVECVYLGMNWAIGQFGLDGLEGIVNGTLSDDLTAADFERFAGFVGRLCRAELEMIAIARRGRPTIVRHVLLNLTMEEAESTGPAKASRRCLRISL